MKPPKEKGGSTENARRLKPDKESLRRKFSLVNTYGTKELCAWRVAPVENLVQRLPARRSGKGWIAKCPAHDDREPSLSISEGADGRVLLRCHAGCDVDSICAALNIRTAALFPAKYPEVSANGAPKAAPLFDWSACVEGFSQKHLERLATWRGYSPEFCSWLKQNGFVGLYHGCVAFPVYGHAGKVAAVHYFLKDGSWRYYPQGTKARPLVIGELVPGDPVQVFESQYDAFAFMDTSEERHGIVVTRGASNCAPVADVIPRGAKVYLWPQNDVPGQKWATDICAYAEKSWTIKLAKTPARHGDLNDWTRAGATSDDLLQAMLSAETVQEAAPVWSPEQLFNEIKVHITRYVVFNQSEDAVVVTLWVMHTWVVQLFDFTPYIYLHSPVMRCGKTQVQRVVEPLVKNPLRTCNISESALFREIADSHPNFVVGRDRFDIWQPQNVRSQRKQTCATQRWIRTRYSGNPHGAR